MIDVKKLVTITVAYYNELLDIGMDRLSRNRNHSKFSSFMVLITHLLLYVTDHTATRIAGRMFRTNAINVLMIHTITCQTL